ncbi:DUF5988 family protein [Streptomyces sp. NPDC001750]|uniref:DUF5988 family protein n=1 Tax=Streptomyces sp. NPDC001750 TaxID=3364607 RepID=UPI00368230E3
MPHLRPRRIVLGRSVHVRSGNGVDQSPPARRLTLELDLSGCVRVKLSGGPDWVPIPAVWEVKSVEIEPKVKILCGNAYEHFDFSGCYCLYEGEQLPIYRWCHRTYVAE